MTLALFIVCLILLAVAIVDRWRRRPELVVSTHSGESVRGRRALSAQFALEEAKLLIADGADQPLGGRLAIPRRNITLVQALPTETDPNPDSGMRVSPVRKP